MFDYIITDIEKYGNKITILPQHRAIGVCRDFKDNKWLECAHAARADYIITGDLDLLDLKNHCGTRIVTPKEYLSIVEVSESFSQ